LIIILFFFKDTAQCWYHNGIVGLGNNIDACVDSIKNLIKDIKYNKIITLGTSAGGYAAILFGILLKVDTILSFSCQTFLDKNNRILYADDSRSEYIQKLYRSNNDAKYYDLLHLDNNVVKNIVLILGIQDQTDIKHINRMKAWSNVKIIEYNAGHAMIKSMRDDGSLLKLLTKYL